MIWWEHSIVIIICYSKLLNLKGKTIYIFFGTEFQSHLVNGQADVRISEHH